MLNQRMQRALAASTLAGLLLATGAAVAGDAGFSYVMGLGRQDLRYRETGSTLPFKSEVRTGSALLVTGALYEVDTDVLFSMNSETTFYPGSNTETWTSTAARFNGVTLTSPVLQQNGYSLNSSHLLLLGHYRVRGPWFASGGLAARTLSFKRYSFVAGPDQAVSTPSGTTVEETAGEVLLQLGAELESEHVRKSDSHYGLRALVGVPVWRRVQNTSVPTLRFDNTAGVDVSFEGRYSRALFERVHLGGWGKWSLSRRGSQVQGTAELPASRLDGWSYGVELLWKL